MTDSPSGLARLAVPAVTVGAVVIAVAVAAAVVQYVGGARLGSYLVLSAVGGVGVGIVGVGLFAYAFG